MMAALRKAGGDAVIGIVLAVVGLGFAVLARPIPFDDLSQPGPGFLPVVLGIALVVVGLACTARAVGTIVPADPAAFFARKPALTVLVLGLAVVALEPVGFLPVAVTFIALEIRLLAGQGWLRAAMLGLCIGGGSWLIFARLLSVPLPPGLLGL